MSSKVKVAVAAGVAGNLAVGTLVAGVAAGGASAAGGRPVMKYFVSKYGTVSGSSHAAPGFAALHVTGHKNELFQIVKPRSDGIGKSQLISDGEAVNQGGNVKPLEAHFKAIGGSTTQNRLYVHLDPGTYFALDVNAKKLTKSKIQTIHVSGARENSPTPEIGGTVTAVGDMKWSSYPNHIAASGFLRFKNRSLKNANNTHFVALEKLKKGKGYSDIKNVFMGKESPDDVFATGKNTSFGTGILSFGKTQISSYKLSPGKYMLACFFPDRATGQPHAFMGMYRAINVG